MDKIWKQLPDDLAWKIIDHLDAVTRRDLGRKPRLVDVPQLNIPEIIPKTDLFGYTTYFIELGNGFSIQFGDHTYSFSAPSDRRVWYMRRT